MMKLASTLALLTAAATLDLSLLGCGQQEQVLLSGNEGAGSLRLALQTGGRPIDSVSAVISGGDGFVTQTHDIDVTGEDGSISIFFGALPSGDYEITLTAGDCSGSSEFGIIAGEVEFVNVALSCGEEDSGTGAVQITGTIVPGSMADCDHLLDIVAAPSIQIGDGPVSTVELLLNPGTDPTTIDWSVASSDGGSGDLLELSGSTDTTVKFDCSTSGSVAVIATVTAPCNDGYDCVEQARAKIECRRR